MNKSEHSKMAPGKKKGSQPKQMNWWLIWLVILGLFLFPVLLNTISGVKEITWQQFEKDMLIRNAVEKIVVVNGEKAEVYIKAELADDSLFKDAFKPAVGNGVNPGPHFYFYIGSAELLERKLEAVEKDTQASEKIPVSYVKKSNWFWSIVAWVLPLIFFVWAVEFHNSKIGRRCGRRKRIHL